VFAIPVTRQDPFETKSFHRSPERGSQLLDGIPGDILKNFEVTGGPRPVETVPREAVAVIYDVQHAALGMTWKGMSYHTFRNLDRVDATQYPIGIREVGKVALVNP
jgi:hypothetical protein